VFVTQYAHEPTNGTQKQTGLSHFVKILSIRACVETRIPSIEVSSCSNSSTRDSTWISGLAGLLSR
jgi:hypothetical protein